MSGGEGMGEQFVKATLAPVTDDTGAPLDDASKRQAAVEVHFNPETLDITLSNNFKQSSGNSPVQLIDEATAQLSLELKFDTTLTGIDVRQDTGKIAAFLKPLDQMVRVGRGNERLPPPKVVEFEWGAIAFQGYIDSYSETLEFFSSDGVPLRASVSLSMTQQERSFEPRSPKALDRGPKDEFSTDSVAGDPFASGAVEAQTSPDEPLANGTAAANGLENARLPGTGTIALPDSSGLGRPPAAFAAAGAGFGAGLSAGIGGGIGIGGGAGIGLSAGASAGIGLSAGAGGGLGFGGAAGAGFGASAGAGLGGTTAAFAGLSVRPPKLELKTASISTSFTASTATTGPVTLGGSVKTQSGASLSAKVGGRISFAGE